MDNLATTAAAAIAPQVSQYAMMQPAQVKPNELSLDKWIVSQFRQTDMDGREAEDKRTQDIVTLVRRNKGKTPSDKFGAFHKGIWNDGKGKFDALHGTNIIQPLLRGAAVNYLQANVQLGITALAPNPRKTSIEKVAKAIYNAIEPRDWNETNHKKIFYGGTLKLNYFIISDFNKRAGGSQLKVPQVESAEYQSSGGMYVCAACGAHGDATALQASGGVCPECGQAQAQIISEPQSAQTEIPSGYSEMGAGETQMTIADGLSFRADDSNAGCADLSAVKWCEHFYLVDEDELRKCYPHLKLTGQPKWSLPTRWRRAFEKEQDSPAFNLSGADRKKREFRRRWFDSALCETYISPVNYELGSFRISANQKLSDVCPKGAEVGFVDDEICYIAHADFHRRVKTGTWIENPDSLWGLGITATVPIQRRVNQLENINMDGINRALRGAVVVDTQAIDPTKLEGANTNIPLRKGFTRTEPVTNYFAALKTEGLSQDALAYLERQETVLEKVMGVPAVSLGEADPHNQTMGGQVAADQRAAGLTIPAIKSEAHAKEGWFLDQCTLIQDFYPLERIREEFGLRFGEELLDDEIQCFLDADLAHELLIQFKEGSETPQTRAQKEAKFAGLYQLGVFNPQMPMYSEARAKFAEIADIELDIDGFESNRKLAVHRFEIISMAVRQAGDDGEMAFQMAQAQMEAMIKTLPPENQEMAAANPPVNPVVLQVLSHPALNVIPEAENHSQMREFYSSRIRDVLSSPKPSLLLLACLREMYKRHNQGMTNEGMKANIQSGLMQAPAQIAGQMIGQELAPPEPKQLPAKGGSSASSK